MMNAKELELNLSDSLQREDILKEKLAESKRELRAADAIIENLQMQVEKLAAENACLKQSIDEVAEAFETGTDVVLANAVDESLNLLTPETDAVLKRIQAQGVAMFASKCKEESKRAYSSDCRDSWWVSGENADDFAAQLRKERE
ncbi:hypothetical protein KK001_07520 [Enterobacter roggenkampii]|uniref:hypothetical protein n=1 Tax=Enterobacter roggenkampii TaxID=1812935 RepID=UPI001BDFE6A7|nr:hypothetical protein [Enterobacter roggenkampii]MBT1888215.1 hypothetical protein [Enterobacter roggenkampii]